MSQVLDTGVSLAAAASPNSRQRPFWKPDRWAYLFTLPAWSLIVLIFLIPIACVVVMSFTDYQMGNDGFRWVGLKNYSTLVFTKDFAVVLGHTLFYVLLVVPTSVILGLLLAIMVRNIRCGSNFYRVVFFLPVTSTLVAMAIVWKYLLHDTIGPVNHFLQWLGLPVIPFFASPDWIMVALAIIGVWQLAGFNMVLFLAGLTHIPQELNEAATMDGADSFWRRLVTVTLPMISPTMLFVVVTSSITAFKLFDSVAVLTKGGPQGSSNVILYKAYQEGFENLDTAGGAAITVVFIVVLVAASWIQARVGEKKAYYR